MLIECQTKWTNFSKELVAIGKELLTYIDRSRTPTQTPTLDEQQLQQMVSKLIKYEQFLHFSSEEVSNSSIQVQETIYDNQES